VTRKLSGVFVRFRAPLHRHSVKNSNIRLFDQRLVDVAQHVIVRCFDCQTAEGIKVTAIKSGTKQFYL
jgi:hypothetical protein